MGGLMRTTSRSEAENGVFGSCINENGTLLEFFTQFDSVIEMQRHRQTQLIAETETSTPRTKTPLLIEKHAASIYTISVFYDVQAEIYEGCFSCKITWREAAEDITVYTIKEGQAKSFQVSYARETGEIQCSCGKFNRVGILCRHVFVVLKDDDAEMIPPKYIVQRWTKKGNAKEIEAHTEDKDENKLAGKVWNEFNNYMALSKGNIKDLHEILNFMVYKKGEMMKSKGMIEGKRKNSDLVDTFYGTQTTTTITIKPPPISKNKGSGKRLKSAREKAADMKKNDGRKCNGCVQKPARHDFCNCLMNPKN
ncbi:protein FAR-RED IMPAIRED RESPONSE 1-like [Ipomoea triloba]|uniref:protein FAR-RED IMPAIRED RESPONSE 1-like n=1 Tax=Ipomoea triloba TaxID=35885 RepID=UPI00125E9C69|nr:protein FAR-RED IMPAIRED RESPONSE 1-like [Ipomoea triloba]